MGVVIVVDKQHLVLLYKTQLNLQFINAPDVHTHVNFILIKKLHVGIQYVQHYVLLHAIHIAQHHVLVDALVIVVSIMEGINQVKVNPVKKDVLLIVPVIVLEYARVVVRRRALIHVPIYVEIVVLIRVVQLVENVIPVVMSLVLGVMDVQDHAIHLVLEPVMDVQVLVQLHVKPIVMLIPELKLYNIEDYRKGDIYGV